MPQIKEITIEQFPDGRMDTKNAALYLGFAKHTLNQMRWLGTGPKFIKPLNGKVFYYREDLDEWLLRGGKLTKSEEDNA